MKKILTLIMSIALLMQGMVTVSARTLTNEEMNEEAIALIDYLEIMDVDTLEGEITRGDFATYMARIMNIDEYSITDKTYFVDMPEDHWATVCVNNLAIAGIFTVNEEKLFRPNDNITVTEAVRALLSAMGYDKKCQLSGGYPAGYMSVAQELKLLKGVNGRNNLTRSDAVILLRNALNTDVFQMILKDDKVAYQQIEGKTLLNVYKEMYYVEGRVEAINETALKPENTGVNGILIDGELYGYTGKNDLIGCEVGAYYIHEKKEEAEIVLMFDRSRDGDIIDIDAALYNGFDENYVISYLPSIDSTTEKKVTIPKNASFVYNGMAVDTDIQDVMDIENGTIRLIRSEDTDEYDIVIIRESETVVTGYVNQNAKKFYDSKKKDYEAGTDNEYDCSDDNSNTKIYDEAGNELTFASIKKGMVLNVYKSKGELMEIYVAAGAANGTYEGSYKDENGDTYVKVDGESYIVSDKYFFDVVKYETEIDSQGNPAKDDDGNEIKTKNILFAGVESKIQKGETVSLLLDIFGKVAAVASSSDTSFTFAYMLDYKLDTDSADEAVYIKLFTEADGLKKYKTAEKVKVDGKLYKLPATVHDAIGESVIETNKIYNKLPDKPTSVTSRVIRIKLNEDNEITDIDTPYRGSNESEKTLQIYGAATDATRIWTGIIGFDITYTSNSKAFTVPTDSLLATAVEKNFTVGGWTVDHNDLIAYTADPTLGASEFLIHVSDKASGSLNAGKNVMFEKIIETIDEDDQPIEYIVAYNNGNHVQYPTSADLVVKVDAGSQMKTYNSIGESGIEKGDIILISTNAAGAISECALAYDCSEEKAYEADVSTGTGTKIFTKHKPGDGEFLRARYRLTQGYVDSLVGSTLNISYERGEEVKERYLIAGSHSNDFTIVVFDRELGKNGSIYKGTVDDIISYKEAGNKCSEIVVYASFMEWRFVYIYN